jgi:Integrase core domain.
MSYLTWQLKVSSSYVSVTLVTNCCYGIPLLVISDKGTNFVNKEFTKFTEEWEFQHTTSSLFHQQGNGKAEAGVKIVKQLVQKAIQENVDFYKMLLVWRKTPNKINYTPAQRFMCRWLCYQVPNIQKYQMIVSSEVRNNIRKNWDVAAQNYNNERMIERRPLIVGQPVWYI